MRPKRAKDEIDNDHGKDDDEISQHCTTVLHTVEPLGIRYRDWVTKSII